MHKKSFIKKLFLFCLISHTTSYSMKDKVDPLALEKEIEAILLERMMHDQFNEAMDLMDQLMPKLQKHVETKQPNLKDEQKNPSSK